MFLDTKTKDVSVWLVKFPPMLVKLLDDIEGDAEIGTLEIIKPDLKVKDAAELQIKLNICNVDFVVQWNEMKQIMYVLKGSTDENVDSEPKLEGRVCKEVFISPKINEKYFKFKNEQLSKVKKSSVKIIDYATKIRPEVYTTISEMDALSRKRKKILQQNKRERLERSEVMDIIFRAFEMQEQWTVKDLADYSGQPNAYILEILQEIGELDKGDFRGSWSLKEEYRSKREDGSE